MLEVQCVKKAVNMHQQYVSIIRRVPDTSGTFCT